MRRFLFTMFFTVFAFSLCAFSTFAAEEAEPNDNKTSATSISLDTDVQGNIADRSDQDWYVISIPKDGLITVELQHELISSSSSYWSIRVYQADGVTGVHDYDEYWSVAGNEAGETPQLGVKAGTYYIKIQRDYYSDVPYTLRVNYTESANTEQEPNASAKTATSITLNTEYTGALSGNQDVDWYQFTLPQDGHISVDFSHEMISSSSSYWKLFLYQFDGVTGVHDYDEYWSVAGNAKGKTPQIGLKAGTYYVKVQREYHSDVPYMLRVNYTETVNTELEPNAAVATATNIKPNTEYYGSIAGSSDVDWYQFTLPQDGHISVDLSHEMISSTSSYWKLFLYQSDGVTGVLDYDEYWSVAGNAKGQTPQIGLKAGTYYVKVQREYHSEVTYTLRVNYTETVNTELEPNAAVATATDIKPNAEYYGSVAGSSDVDWYRFSLTSSAQISIHLYHELLSSSSEYWEVCLYSSDGVSEIFNNSVPGNSNGSFDVGELSAGTYYIKIKREYHSDVTYKLNISEKHDCTGKWVMKQEATCTGEGTREEVCAICGKSLKTEVVPALGHVSDNWTVVKASTCVETGYRYGNCDRCHEDVEEVTPLLPHAYGQWQIISGNKVIPPIVKEQTCQQCGYVNTVKDWSYIWITILVAVAAVGVVIGIVNYVKAFKSKS